MVGAHLTTNGQEPFYRQLTEEDGLPSMTIYQTHQDKKGFIWFGTENGICRYDGKEMQTYGDNDLLDNEILTIQEDNRGRIWFRNLAGQLAWVADGKINIAEYDKKGKLFEFLVIDSVLFTYTRATNDVGVHRMHFERYDISEEGNLKYKFRFNTEGENGLRRLDLSDSKIYALQTNPYFSLLEFKIESPSVQEYKYEQKDTNFNPIDIEISKNKEVLFFLPNLRQIDQYRIREDSLIYQSTFPTGSTDITFFKSKYFSSSLEQELMKNIFESLRLNYGAIIKDKEGNIWSGTIGNGVIIFPQLEIIHYTKYNSNLKENPINVIYSDSKDKLLLGQIKGEYALMDGNQLLSKQVDNRLRRLKTIVEDEYGNYWFGGDGVILLQLDEYLNVEKKFPGGIKEILPIDKDNVWLASSNSLINLRNGYDIEVDLKSKEVIYDKYKDIKTIFPNRTYSLLGNLEKMWIGCSNGIYLYQHKEFVPFLENGEHVPYSVSKMVQSKDSIVWVATLSHGVLGIKNDSIRYRINETNGLATNNCSNLFYDEYHNLWVGSKKGLHQVDLNTLEVNLINKFDGMPTDDISAIHAKDSVVWIGTQKGLLKMPYSAIHKNEVPPPIHITNIAFWDKDTTLQSSYDLAFDQNNLNIEFVGLTYRNHGTTQYKYRMIGLDSNWVSTVTRFARFPILNPGSYEFQVKAINEDGVESINPAKINLVINYPWWRTWWFYFVVTTTLFGVTYVLYNNRIKQIKKEQEFNDKIRSLRMMALQAQMNPHFVFNSLSAIQKFLTTNEQEQAMIYLARFAQLIRTIFEQSKEQLITLEEEFEFLQLYLDLEKLRFKDKVTIEFNITPSITKDDYDILIPPLIIQPIIENAFKHGLMHKEEGGQLKVEFRKDVNFLTCQIEDNGIGRAMAKKMGEGKLRPGRSSGLKTAEERLEILNKSSEAKNVESLSIEDLVDHNQNPIGTRVEIKIQLES